MSKPLSAIEAAKRLAAYTAVDKHIFPQHRVIGIGSGSTVPYVVERIVAQGVDVNRHRVFIPTGFQSKNLILDAGLVLGDIEQYSSLDVALDGADEVDPALNCIKGGGACQLREKVLAEAAQTFVVVADYRKDSPLLGTNWAKGVPLEVVPFGYTRVLQRLQSLGAPRDTGLRMAGTAKAGPVVSDNGNFIVDAVFPPDRMRAPAELLRELKAMTGIVEVGLFCGIAKAAYFGNEDGSVTIRNTDGSVETVAAASESIAGQEEPPQAQ